MLLKRGIKGIQCIRILLQSNFEAGASTTAKCAEDQNENDRKKKTEKDGSELSNNGPETGFGDCPNGLTLAVWVWQRITSKKWKGKIAGGS